MINLSRTYFWRKLRERKILADHKRAADICKSLIDGYEANPIDFGIKPKRQFNTDRIIWQYWAQGYDDVPDIVKKCLESVDKWSNNSTIIRLTDNNLSDYLEIPEFVQTKRSVFSRAFFSDLLRLMLLKTYGGVWLDATVCLSGPIPENYWQYPFFIYRRDASEPNIKYWRNTYAYYFGWAKGFRVNMLSSIMFAKKGSETAADLCNYMLLWWKEHTDIPDYFFIQILYDVYKDKEAFPLISDTLPHYLQQSINDPRFTIMKREDILREIPIHKLTYK
ncbi:MAG: capsular biosynthesis protein [Bacteroidales bacterium]|nr:capsular biosynthesis protein [Bacteroidales bacterium]